MRSNYQLNKKNKSKDKFKNLKKNELDKVKNLKKNELDKVNNLKKNELDKVKKLKKNELDKVKKLKKNELDKDIIKEINPKNYCDSIFTEALPIIMEQAKTSVCKIITKKGETGTGFLCKIPFPDSFTLLPVLITCYHVLEKKDIIEGNTIELNFNNEEKKIILTMDKSRRFFVNDEKYDITIIEIKHNDGIDMNNFLDVDDYLYKNDNLNNIYSNKNNIYLIHYPNGFKSKISFGNIKKIDINNNKIEYICTTDKGSSGSPIINISNYKIIGIHNADHPKFQIKIGTLLKLPISEFFINETQKNKINIGKIIDNKSDKNEKKINSNKTLNVDILIEKLLSVKNFKPGKEVDLKEEEIKFIIDKSFPIIKKEKVLLELEAPFQICGDIYGQYYDLLRIFEHMGYPGEYKYLFLGNYVDFGKQGLEVLCLLLCYKIKYPEKVILLRGNHESSVVTRIYGFYDECKRRYNINIWRSFILLFNYLPIAAVISENIFCVHGGLSPDLNKIEDILEVKRPTDIPDSGLLCDLLNSDPDIDVIEYDENDKGYSVVFGEKIVLDFIKKNDLDLIVRGNQAVDDGFEFFAQRHLLTIFSAPNFLGEMNNSSGILLIDENLNCSLKVLRPVENLIK